MREGGGSGRTLHPGRGDGNLPGFIEPDNGVRRSASAQVIMK